MNIIRNRPICFLLLCLFISHSCGFFMDDIINKVVSPFFERCDSRWVPRNISGLEEDLYSNVFGQELAINVILTALHSYLSKTSHKKPLVLSFHGWTGGGKTFIKDFILKHWFMKGHESKFVKLYFAERDFPLNNGIDQYKMRLHKELEETISLCPKALFVFDEVDKYPPLVLDAIKPYLDYNSNINGYDYRQAIFIFITNIGGGLISQIAFKNWEQGVSRENMRLRDFEETLRTLAFNQDGGFYRSELIKHHLIDYIVPFLPLERSHVQSCVEALFEDAPRLCCRDKEYCQHIITDQLLQSGISEIMEDVIFDKQYPQYASQGCHNLEPKVCLKVQEWSWRGRESRRPTKKNNEL